MSDTPRTDAAAFQLPYNNGTWAGGKKEVVNANDARAIERELAAVQAEVEKLRADAERWKCLTAHAILGFDVPSWDAVIRLPVFDAADQTIGALVDSIRAALKETK